MATRSNRFPPAESRHVKTLAVTLALLAATAAPAGAAVSFSPAPNAPNLPTVTLSGGAQTNNATMANWGVSQTLPLSGWNVTVSGDTSAGKSAVFKQYCPNATCGSDSGPGYIAGGETLSAGSLLLNSTGASWTGNIGSQPSHVCNSGCSMDTTTAVKVASATNAVLLGTWTTTGYSSTSLALSMPTTVRVLTQPGEIYRVDLVWTLGTGP
jgi:hypothetical protein